MGEGKVRTSFKSGNVPSCSPCPPINSYPLLLAPTLWLLSNITFSSIGNLNSSAEPLNTFSCSEGEIPCPISWKKPVEVHASFTAAITFWPEGEVGERR